MMQMTGDRVTGGKTGTGEGSTVPGAKQRVYEVAKDVGLENKELVGKARALGIEIKNHMSALEPDDVLRIKRALDKERQENTVTERIQPTVIRRRNKSAGGQPGAVGLTGPVSSAPVEAETEVPEAPRRVVGEPPVTPKGPSAMTRSPQRAETPSAEPVDATSETMAGAEGSASPRAPAYDEEELRQAKESQAERQAVRPMAPAPVAPIATGPKVVSRVAKVQRVVDHDTRGRDAAPSQMAARPSAPATSPAEERGLKSGQVTELRESGPSVSALARESSSVSVIQAQEGTPRAAARPRTQFELDLEKAREAAAAKQAVLAAQRSPEQSAPLTGLGRPQVGSIIDLPLPRIQITERGPGGRPLTAGTRGVPAQTTSIPGAGQVRGRFAEAQRGGGRKQDMAGLGRKRIPPGKKARSTQITTPAEHKRIIKMDETIAIGEISHQMGVKATEVLKKLWSMGMVGVNINQSIDTDTASLLAGEFGYEVQNTAFQETAILTEAADAPEDLEARAPVVTVMGHVDHGKTSLLDTIRHTEVAAGEAGGITQHIGAYRVSASGIGDVVFLDTPGHAAFTAMRARGAQATDIVVLVVAADDGVMPQTVEALNHAKDAEVPIVVAVNKCDRAQANPDRIRQQLSEHGLIPDEWGGETMYVNVSAYTKMGIDKLLEAIQLQAELLELKANPKKLARGVVVEAKLDRNRGPMATVLVEDGTLRIGDIVVAGEHMGKVRAMLNDKGSAVTEAGPSTPVELLGLDGVPEAGDVLNAIAEEKAARSIIENRRDLRRKKEQATTGKVSLENILEKIQEGQVKELKVVLKTDVQGSAEALKEALTKQSTEQVKVNVIQAGAGGITESDVNLAKAGGAIIIGFHVRPAGKASQLAEQEGVDIKLYDIIYEAIDDVKKAMVGLLAPIKKERALGKVEVRDIFSIPKIGTVAGCFVADGKVNRQAQIRLVRDNVQIYGGRLGSLKRFKEDVREVTQGYECGLTIDGYNDLRIGDVIEAYDIVEEAPTL